MAYIGKLVRLTQWLCLVIGPSYVIAGIVSWRTGIDLKDLVGAETTWTNWMVAGIAATIFGLFASLSSTGYRFRLSTLWIFSAATLVLLALGLRVPLYMRWFVLTYWAFCVIMFSRYAIVDLLGPVRKAKNPN